MTPVLWMAALAVAVTALSWAARRHGGERALAGSLLAAAVVAAALRQTGLALVLGGAGLTLWKRGRARPTPQQSSEVQTEALAMTLDHDSGRMDGAILTGSQAGRRLSELSIEELQALMTELAGDAESLSLLLAYLERERGGAVPDPPPTGELVTETEAYNILGLQSGASLADVRAAHRRLIRKLHPDLGGTSALTAMINAAKDRLDPQ